MTAYRFREGSRLTGDANVVAKELEAIRQQTGALTPHAVLHAASRTQHPLHQYFEWDNRKAADAYRLERAGHLIRCITVVIEPEPDSSPVQLSIVGTSPAPAALVSQVRAFVPVRTSEGDRIYLATNEALADNEYRRQVLAQAHSELGSVARKYRELQELAGVITAIDRVGELLTESHAGEISRRS